MKTIVLLFIAGFVCNAAAAQSITPQVINTTGGTFKQGYYALDWSIGEVPLVDEYKPSGETYIVTNGFLQSFTDKPASPVIPRGFGKDEIVILPNPTAGRLEVNFLMNEKGLMELTLFDAIGQRLTTRRISLYGYGKFERFDLTGLPGSTYFLLVEFIGSTGLNKRGSYKIEKIK